MLCCDQCTSLYGMPSYLFIVCSCCCFSVVTISSPPLLRSLGQKNVKILGFLKIFSFYRGTVTSKRTSTIDLKNSCHLNPQQFEFFIQADQFHSYISVFCFLVVTPDILAYNYKSSCAFGQEALAIYWLICTFLCRSKNTSLSWVFLSLSSKST